jgi:hypothetical protein
VGILPAKTPNAYLSRFLEPFLGRGRKTERCANFWAGNGAHHQLEDSAFGSVSSSNKGFLHQTQPAFRIHDCGMGDASRFRCRVRSSIWHLRHTCRHAMGRIPCLAHTRRDWRVPDLRFYRGSHSEGKHTWFVFRARCLSLRN